MVDGLICVQDTDYSDYFENVERDTVFLLSINLAESAWDREVCEGSSSYFNSPDDCWIIAGESTLIGRWIEAYNADDNSALEKLLRRQIDWPDTAIIKFFANKKVVFQTTWYNFLRYWDGFIAVEDDCPILIPEKSLGKQALVFRPIGDIQKIFQRSKAKEIGSDTISRK